jgi:hypothetical protein
VTRTLEAVCLKMRADHLGVRAVKVENWKARAVKVENWRARVVQVGNWKAKEVKVGNCWMRVVWHKRLEPGRNRAAPGFLHDLKSC